MHLEANRYGGSFIHEALAARVWLVHQSFAIIGTKEPIPMNKLVHLQAMADQAWSTARSNKYLLTEALATYSTSEDPQLRSLCMAANIVLAHLEHTSILAQLETEQDDDDGLEL